MRIFIDIGHPAHVHYFRNFIRLMEEKGHEFFVSARNKEVSQALLDKYGISYFNRGRGFNSLAGKLAYMIRADIVLYRKCRSFKPDIFMSFASPYAAHVSKLMGKPHIAFTDTDNARLGILSFSPFTDVILTPASFKKDLGHGHIRFKSFMELGYLYPGYFEPDSKVYNELGLEKDEEYVFFRFVSFNANHDIGHSGLDSESKISLVNDINRKYRVFVSSESPLPEALEKFRLNLAPDRIHSVLAGARLFIGEGATMASECAMLGTPAIYVNSISAGTLEEQEKYGLLFRFENSSGVAEKASELLAGQGLKEEFRAKRLKMLEDHIDLTSFMVWFVDNYPQSSEMAKNDREISYNWGKPGFKL